MRDLERIREVREYRLTGPQVRSLGLSAVVLLAALFVTGYQLGRLNSPVDASLLAPAGSGRDAGAVLADLLSRHGQSDPAARSGEAALASTTVTPERTLSDEPRGPSLVASDEPRGASLVASDETRAPLDQEPIPAGVALMEAADAAADARGDHRQRVVEVVERSFPEEPVPSMPAVHAAAEDPPAPIVLPPSLPPSRSASAQLSGALRGPPAGKGFTVQLGAYESLDEARAVFAALQGRGLDPYHISAEVGGKVWHRVRVGLYEHREQADAAAVELSGVTPFPPFVTRQP